MTTLPAPSFFDVETDLPFSPARWRDNAAKPQEWIVEHLIPKGSVTLLSGDGGKGKSLLCQQLQTCLNAGTPFLGLKAMSVKSFGLYCEDDRDDLERRQNHINRHYGLMMGDLDSVTYWCRKGRDSILAQYEWGPQSKPTKLMESVVGAATRLGCQLVVLDTASDVFGGNEIRRDQVRNFITHLTWLARHLDGAVLLTAHVSNEGLSSGSGLAGSRAWSNSVRCRSWLTGGDGSERVLKVMKSNYGPSGGKIPLIWRDGVFVVTEPKKAKSYAETEDDWR